MSIAAWPAPIAEKTGAIAGGRQRRGACSLASQRLLWSQPVRLSAASAALGCSCAPEGRYPGY
eukprot:COSAG06_NODE_1006_length_11107_cov_10.602017_6_plen_63_part_00